MCKLSKIYKAARRLDLKEKKNEEFHRQNIVSHSELDQEVVRARYIAG